MPATLPDASVGLVGLEDIQDGGRGGILIRPTEPKEIQSLKTWFRTGDILYGKLRPYLNKVGIAPVAGLCSTEIWAFEAGPLIDARYAAFFLASSFFIDRVASLTKGANLPRLDTDAFDSTDIPLPPLSEQQRIVEILREAEEIHRLRAEAEAKSAALISAMFFDHFIRGSEHNYEPLQKLADVESGVALGRKTKGMAIDVPYLRVANVQAGYVDLSEVKETPATDDEIRRFSLETGDVLLTEGGDFDKLGRGCLWDGQIDPCIHQNHVFRVRPFREKLNPQFFAHYLQSARAKHYFLRCAKKTTNLASINLTQLKALPVPNISIDRQEAFEEQIRVAAESDSNVDMELFLELRRSLAAHAFSGKLTASWREAHFEELAAEARQRDTELKQTHVSLAAAITVDLAVSATLTIETEGRLSDLSREQRDLYVRIRQDVLEEDGNRYFTAESLSRSLDNSLRRNPQSIEGHLAVLAARGLVIPLSLEEQAEDTGAFVFGNAYRLPEQDWNPGDAENQGADRIGDQARGRELERLAALLEQERVGQ